LREEKGQTHLLAAQKPEEKKKRVGLGSRKGKKKRGTHSAKDRPTRTVMSIWGKGGRRSGAKSEKGKEKKNVSDIAMATKEGKGGA